MEVIEPTQGQLKNIYLKCMPGFKKKNILEDQSLLATAMDHPQDETQPKT